MRKTINVAEIVTKLNAQIAALPIGDTPEAQAAYQAIRNGLRSAVETILHDSGNYAGFSYLDTSEGKPFVKGETDESRVHYYISHKLRS